YSDQICTALQLTNFYQDLSLDIEKDRFYISEDTLNRFELSYDDLIYFKTSKLVNDNFKQMMKYLIDFNFNLFNEGENLLGYLNGLFKKDIKLTLEGGREILHKIISSDYNPFLLRPKLDKFDWLKIILRSLI
ncbi:MAG: squalene/phytoene synthase family protein, partial [Ignavibacteria bacterium]